MTDKRIAEELMRTYDVQQVVRWYVQETNEAENEAKERVYKVLSKRRGLNSECYLGLWTWKNRKWLLGSKFKVVERKRYMVEEYGGMWIIVPLLLIIFLMCCWLSPMWMVAFISVLCFIVCLIAK